MVYTGRRPIDHGWAWVILSATTSLMIIVVGNVRSFGIFFLEMQQMFDTSSSTISTLLSIEHMSICISGVLAMNFLIKFISIRTIVLCSCAMCSLTFIFDSVTKNPSLLPLNHILNGAGVSTIYGSCIVVQSTYFHRYLGTANAISACGVSIGQFTLPYLLNFLILTYGVRGALLLNASIFLQCFVFAALLRPMSYYDAMTTSKLKCFTVIELEVVNSTDDATMEKQTESLKEKPDHSSEILSSSYSGSNNRGDTCGQNDNLQSVESSKLASHSLLSPLVVKEQIDSKDNGKCDYSKEKSSIESIAIKTPLQGLLDELRRNWQKLLAATDFTLFKEKIFICGFIGAILGNAVSSLPQILFPAHSVDLGLTSKEGIVFLTISGVADFVGRLLIISLADRKFVNRARLLGVSLMMHGITACFVSYYTNFFLFAMYCACYGLVSGIHFSLTNTVIVDFIGAQRISDAIGFIILGTGIIGTVAFPVIGYLRDVSGSYNIGFILNGVGLLISGAMFLMEAFISYPKHQRRADI